MMKSKFSEKFFEDKTKYYIVIAFFNYMLKSDFCEIVKYFGDEIGYSFETLGCTFSSIFDNEDEEGYFDNGVMFNLNEEEVIISFSMFIKCLELARDIFIEEHNNQNYKNMIDENIQIIKNRYAIG